MKSGSWAQNDLRRAFVDGAAWWEYHKESATMWNSDRDLAESAADTRYPNGKPFEIGVNEFSVVETEKSEIPEWICNKCHRVFLANESYARCCWQIERFDLEKHGRDLIGLSNSWIDVWEKWKNHKTFERVSRKITEDGCYGAATAINAFVEELLKETNRK